MDQELAKAAMQFLMRVDLKGAEVPAFNAVMMALQAIAAGRGDGDDGAKEEIPRPTSDVA